ncbi:hypothetical protein SLEP1_g48639 [Rubroshorea leprosula]|uniref:Pentatricopeptide repeat-containing protein n=1 Tax=Rubroshorea leprosula TaxID=152421 RepID=A0AAV5LU73_9ROSI|nr:hypothetical protein SLEP1_g48639 [Rubroshorea leprosula]
MKRAFRLAEAAQTVLPCLHGYCSTSQSQTPFSFVLTKSTFNRCFRDISGQTPHSPLPASVPGSIIDLFIDKLSNPEPLPREGLDLRVSKLRDELVQYVDRFDEATRVLEEKADSLIKISADGRAFVELLKQLSSSPHFALEVFKWRRNHSEHGNPMTSEEYTQGITLAGRLKRVDLACNIFDEAAGKKVKATSIYNALMSAYMYNGLAEKCQLLFRDLKTDTDCAPSLTTYNILISLFGRLLLVDHMEAAFQEIKHLNLSPNTTTYNNLIAGYLTAWMWTRMESTFQMMKVGLVKPDFNTHLLMLRGYAHSGKLDKMEETYELIKDYLNEKKIPSILTMICAYSKSHANDRVKKIEALMKFIPENQYWPWLNVLLIQVYAQENSLEHMESLINLAFEHQTIVLSSRIMRCIIATYFQCNAVDRLAIFVKRAECAGWKMCRSLYHCKMVLYGLEKRLEEMESVLNEMDNIQMNWTKKTFWILYKSYSTWGPRYKVEQVVGLMCKHGYEIPLEASSS